MPTGEDLYRASLTDQVHGALREEIVSGRLAPRQRISVGRYANLWSISPTPLRDAIKRLEADGFVEVLPRRGVFVAQLGRKALKEIFEIRIAFECTAIGLAIENIPIKVATETLNRYLEAQRRARAGQKELLREVDFLIHNIAQEYCRNTRLQKMMSSVNDLVQWSRQSIIRNIPQPYETTLPEHIRISRAVCERDKVRAVEEMFHHLRNSLDRIYSYFDERSTEIPSSLASGAP